VNRVLTIPRVKQLSNIVAIIFLFTHITLLFISFAEAMDELERLRRRIEDYPFSYEGRKLQLTVTIGLAWLGEEQSIQACIGVADRKLYEGKNSGKNCVCA